eukprot:gene18755-20646_t
MGRYRKKKGGNNTKNNSSRSDNYENGKSYKETVRENEQLEKYYKDQNILPESEWEEFSLSLRRDLPSTFRITGTRSHAEDLLRALKESHVKELEEITDSDEQPSLMPIKWYPNELAWETKVAKRFIRKSEKLKEFHNFLVDENNCGAVTRQEAVSMIPPLFMDVKPHHKVLDMCAAPGSKTAQLIEMMDDGDENELPSGVVIANDSCNKRCYMLVHQSRRLQSSCCMVTNHDASIFPFLITVNESTGMKQPVLFDRILCDVPCSGDGTMRKNPQIWQRWTPHIGVGLHRLQMKILVRGLEMLAEGGRLVYSTCSMNPIEDEAVIATALQMCKGAVELIDVSNEIPDLKRSPGLLTWKVFNKAGDELKTNEDVLNAKATEGYKNSMFPPTLEEAQQLNLNRCMRVYPHQQDTGGFFIAVLRKTKVLPWQSTGKAWRMAHRKLLPWEFLQKKTDQLTKDASDKESDTPSDAVIAIDNEKPDTEAISTEQNTKIDEAFLAAKAKGDLLPPLKKRKRSGYREDPFVFVKEDDPILNTILNFYGFPSTFPKKQVLIRTDDGIKRNIYFVSKTMRDILTYNGDNLKVINSGVKIFTRCSLKTGVDQECDFRITQEGIDSTYRFIEKQKVEIHYDDLVLLLTEGEVTTTRLTESTQRKLENLDLGCVIWYYKATKGDTEAVHLSSDIWMCGYRVRTAVRCMMPKTDRLHFLRVLGIPTDRIKKSTVKKEPVVITDVTENSADDDNDDDEIKEEALEDDFDIEEKDIEENIQKGHSCEEEKEIKKEEAIYDT